MKNLATTLKEYLNESISDERNGVGNYLKTSMFNIVNGELPDYLVNIHDSALNYWEETQEVFNYDKKILNRNKIVFSTQENVSKTFIDSMTSEIYDRSDIILTEDEHKNLWLLDGHHRLIYDRIHSRGLFI